MNDIDKESDFRLEVLLSLKRTSDETEYRIL